MSSPTISNRPKLPKYYLAGGEQTNSTLDYTSIDSLFQKFCYTRSFEIVDDRSFEIVDEVVKAILCLRIQKWKRMAEGYFLQDTALISHAGSELLRVWEAYTSAYVPYDSGRFPQVEEDKKWTPNFSEIRRAVHIFSAIHKNLSDDAKARQAFHSGLSQCWLLFMLAMVTIGRLGDREIERQDGHNGPLFPKRKPAFSLEECYEYSATKNPLLIREMLSKVAEKLLQTLDTPISRNHAAQLPKEPFNPHDVDDSDYYYHYKTLRKLVRELVEAAELQNQTPNFGNTISRELGALASFVIRECENGLPHNADFVDYKEAVVKFLDPLICNLLAILHNTAKRLNGPEHEATLASKQRRIISQEREHWQQSQKKIEDLEHTLKYTSKYSDSNLNLLEQKILELEAECQRLRDKLNQKALKKPYGQSEKGTAKDEVLGNFDVRTRNKNFPKWPGWPFQKK